MRRLKALAAAALVITGLSGLSSVVLATAASANTATVTINDCTSVTFQYGDIPSGGITSSTETVMVDGATVVSKNFTTTESGSPSDTVSFTASNGQTVSASTTYTTSDGTFSGGPVSESASGCATTGDFVIGNLNSAIGTPVTFWGAQWAKSNSLSGGPAPNAFKGYALNPSMPTCGETWTTSPGNSPPPPPGPLPAFIEIIVSSNITQSGNTISGDIQSIVIVATNGGYEANPGHPGTGTVVSVVC